MNERHYDDGTSIRSFTDCFLVRCPKCDSCASVVSVKTEDRHYPPEARFTCMHCGATKVSQKVNRKKIRQNTQYVDWFFKYPLWLQIPCSGEILWAYNLSHLQFLESYIQASHRIGLREDQATQLGIRNATLASRLPEWMIIAKHREEVLKGIQKLKRFVSE